jgi:nucleoside-diphosphate-sugar epimerase
MSLDLRGRRIGITGITGAVGSALARRALEAGAHVCAVVRAEDDASALHRAADALLAIGTDPADIQRLSAFRGDITQPRLGLTDLPGIDLLLHAAACIDFNAPWEELARINVQGTTHALDLAEEIGCDVAYVGTAYLAGQRTGLVKPDEIDVGQDFHNDYERSKCAAEGVVCAWRDRTARKVWILRLGIVTGDSRDGAILRFTALYEGLAAIDLISRRIGQGDLRLDSRQEATLNLVPADWLAEATWRLITEAPPAAYHLTNPTPPTLHDIAERFAKLFGLGEFLPVDAAEFDERPPTRAERILAAALSSYRPYMREEAIFDRTNVVEAIGDLHFPAFDDVYCDRLLTFARLVGWGRTPIAPTPEPTDAYFQNFLPEQIGQTLLPKHVTLSADFAINITDSPDDPWSMRIDRGCLTRCARESLPVQCTFEMAGGTLLDIAAARLNTRKAFFTRRVVIRGDMEVGLKLASGLGDFFQRVPYTTGC